MNWRFDRNGKPFFIKKCGNRFVSVYPSKKRKNVPEPLTRSWLEIPKTPLKI